MLRIKLLAPILLLLIVPSTANAQRGDLDGLGFLACESHHVAVAQESQLSSLEPKI